MKVSKPNLFLKFDIIAYFEGCFVCITFIRMLAYKPAFIYFLRFCLCLSKLFVIILHSGKILMKLLNKYFIGVHIPQSLRCSCNLLTSEIEKGINCHTKILMKDNELLSFSCENIWSLLYKWKKKSVFKIPSNLIPI